MPTHCPFCAAQLPPTDDAFCSECRGRLDEASQPGQTTASVPQSDLELRERLSIRHGETLTALDVLICLCAPLIGLIIGAVRLSQGRASGKQMMLVAGCSMGARLFIALMGMMR